MRMCDVIREEEEKKVKKLKKWQSSTKQRGVEKYLKSISPVTVKEDTENYRKRIKLSHS